jgi:hypothetical protein
LDGDGISLADGGVHAFPRGAEANAVPQAQEVGGQVSKEAVSHQPSALRIAMNEAHV